MTARGPSNPKLSFTLSLTTDQWADFPLTLLEVAGFNKKKKV
jgi:hypothetical protein